MFLSGSLLLIGLGWARPVPISDAAEKQNLAHFNLLLASSLFNNMLPQRILATPPMLSDASSKRGQESAGHSPSKAQRSSSIAFSDDLLFSSGSTQDADPAYSTNCFELFPNTLTSEAACDLAAPSESSLRKLCHHFWCDEGNDFFLDNGNKICQVATDFFICMVTPSKIPFSFKYNLAKNPKILVVEIVTALNCSFASPFAKRGPRFYVSYYVFIVCYLALGDRHFGTVLSKRFNMPTKRMSNIIHQSNKLLKVWGKDMPLARMDSEVVERLFKLKVAEVDSVVDALDLLKRVRAEEAPSNLLLGQAFLDDGGEIDVR